MAGSIDNYYNSEEFKTNLNLYETSKREGKSCILGSEELADIAEYYFEKGKLADAKETAEYAASLYPDATAPKIVLARYYIMVKKDKEKAKEVVGEKKEKAVRDAVAKNQIERDPVTKSEVVIIDSNSNTLCYEPLSGRYFKSTIDKIKKAEIKLDRQMIQEMYVSLNDFYWEIGLDGTDLGDQMGWNLSKGYMDLSFSSQLADDGTPCAVIVYGIPPVYDYQNY